MSKKKKNAFIPVMLIDKATVGFDQVKINGEDGIKPWDLDDSYKFLTVLPLGEGGALFPVASKDGQNWEICFGAEQNGELIDLISFKAEVEKTAMKL